ncbi:MAG: hypothetical protein ACM3P0_19975 [Acidobacteriota bacterium]
MLKLKITAVITVILGLVSLVWIFYDYFALTNIVYNQGQQDLSYMRKTVTLGFIPIILFHFAFFTTMYFLFDFLKKQKPIIKEHARFKADQFKADQFKADQLKAGQPNSGEIKTEAPGKDKDKNIPI